MTDRLPSDLPVPGPSKAALHLPGHPLPPLTELPSTSGGFVDLFLLSLSRPILLFIYPRTAAPGEQIKESWNQIPGARGCTPELCSIRDGIGPLLAKEPTLAIFGLSTQSNDYQKEVVQRLRLPYPLLSDSDFKLHAALDLPTFEWESTKYLQRITLLLREGQITQIQYPVFPSDSAANAALEMLAPLSTTSDDEMKMNEACVDVPDHEGQSHFRHPTPSSLLPLPPAAVGTNRSSRKGAGSEWRNSLVVMDDETGDVLGVLARGVSLSSGGTCEGNDEDDDDDDSSEALTPQQRLVYTAAHVYDDPDVRPPSRAGSVLGEATFAPPPVPEKAEHLRVGGKGKHGRKNSGSLFSEGEEEEAESEGDVVDGKVKVRAHHAEAHRPDLLRDRHAEGDQEGHNKDASGSTIGGPAVQLWKKARGGKEGEAKRKDKKEAKRVLRENEKNRKLRVPEVREPSKESARASQAVTAVQGDDEVKQSDLASAQVVPPPAAEEDTGDAAEDEEEGAIEMQPKGWQGGTKKSAMSHHLQGNSVLIEFLAGSRIGASVIQGASLLVPKERSAATLRGPDAFTPTHIAAIPQTGALAYIPVLPSHLLWFFGLGGGAEERGAEKPREELAESSNEEAGLIGSAAVMGEDLVVMAKATAKQGASLAWSSLSGWSTSASTWLSSSMSLFIFQREIESDEQQVERGDKDDDEWEWTMPSFDSTTLDNTPRPIYRRKKLIPSLVGNFNARTGDKDEAVQSDNCSIVHFDHLGIARRAFTRTLGS